MNMLYEAFPGGGHLVILGARASIASTIRNPERWNRKLHSMNDLPNVISIARGNLEFKNK